MNLVGFATNKASRHCDGSRRYEHPEKAVVSKCTCIRVGVPNAEMLEYLSLLVLPTFVDANA